MNAEENKKYVITVMKSTIKLINAMLNFFCQLEDIDDTSENDVVDYIIHDDITKVDIATFNFHALSGSSLP